MRPKKILVLTLLLTLLLGTLIGCSSEVHEPVPVFFGNNRADNTIIQPLSIKVMSEVTRDDFVYRLVSVQDSYENGHDVSVYAELDYIGDQDSVTIYHAASPFWFPIHEKTRDYHIGYFMDQPLITTVIEKGTPFREEYLNGVSFNADNDPGYAEFAKALSEEGFPKGDYIVNGRADFYILYENTENKFNYNLTTAIAFKVTD